MRHEQNHFATQIANTIVTNATMMANEMLVSAKQEVLLQPPIYDLARSSQWSDLRNSFLEKYPYCVACGTNNDLNVHHIKPYHLFPELELEESNLITLCQYRPRNCHFALGHLFDWRAWDPQVIQHAGYLWNLILS